MTSIRKKMNKARELGFSQTRILISNKVRKSLNLLPSVPPTLYVELTNRCNLNCIMCDRESMTRKQGQIDMALFKKVIDNAAEIHVPEVKLNRFGEPLLHPQIIEMIKYAKGRGIPRVYFTNNATLLTEEKARAIVEAGLDAITCSVDGAKPETYQKVRGIPKFQEITANIERLAQIKKSLGRTKPELIINTILMKETEAEIVEVFRRWEGIADRINVIPVASYGKVEVLSSVKREDSNQLRPCNHLFDRLMVFWDGTVTVCCGDIDGKLKIGTFPEQRLETLWKNERLTRLRKLHRARELHDIPICLNCDGTKELVFRRMQQQRRNAYERAGKPLKV